MLYKKGEFIYDDYGNRFSNFEYDTKQTALCGVGPYYAQNFDVRKFWSNMDTVGGGLYGE